MSDIKDINKTKEAIEFLLDWGDVHEAQHKMWVIDQTLRILAGDDYDSLIKQHSCGEDGPGTYYWDIGVAP